jgi:hypothetical protein
MAPVKWIPFRNDACNFICHFLYFSLYYRLIFFILS